VNNCSFIEAHDPPKDFQTLRYYGTYSNKARGRAAAGNIIIKNAVRNVVRLPKSAREGQ
jgi:hypothetical protein